MIVYVPMGPPIIAVCVRNSQGSTWHGGLDVKVAIVGTMHEGNHRDHGTLVLLVLVGVVRGWSEGVENLESFLEEIT